jgi:prepilin peptidase CpaA
MALAGAMDLFTMTIPNRISMVLVAGFVLMAPLVGFSVEQFAMYVACGVVMMLVGMLLFSAGWIGGGDAKIFAAASLWFGFGNLLPFIAICAIAGGILTLGLLVFRCIPLPLPLVRQTWLARLHDRKTGVPYGIAIAAAALMIYPSTVWMTALAG